MMGEGEREDLETDRKRGSEPVVSDKANAWSMTHIEWETGGQKQQLCCCTPESTGGDGLLLFTLQVSNMFFIIIIIAFQIISTEKKR